MRIKLSRRSFLELSAASLAIASAGSVALTFENARTPQPDYAQAIRDCLRGVTGQFLSNPTTGVGPVFDFPLDNWDVRGVRAFWMGKAVFCGHWPVTGPVWGFGLFQSGRLKIAHRCFGGRVEHAYVGSTMVLDEVMLDFSSRVTT